jgi:hypothetical protein
MIANIEKTIIITKDEKDIIEKINIKKGGEEGKHIIFEEYTYADYEGEIQYPEVGPALTLSDLDVDEGVAHNAICGNCGKDYHLPRSTCDISPSDELAIASVSFDLNNLDKYKAKEDTCDEYWNKYEYYDETTCCCCYKELGFKGCFKEEEEQEEQEPEELDLKDMYAASMEMSIKSERE